MTGSYNNYFYILDQERGDEVLLQADKSAFKQKRNIASAKTKLLGGGKKPLKKEDINVDTIDFNKKILHAAWHPKENTIAIAATNNLFIFSHL